MEPDHKELLIGLIGSTYGELKRLDDSITGSSSTLNKRSDMLRQEMVKVVNNAPASKDVPLLEAIKQSPAPQPTTPEVTTGVIEVPQPLKDTSSQVPIFELPETKSTPQLELDLFKPTKYEDILNSVDSLYSKLNKIEDKVDQILVLLNKPKKKARGLVDS